jgi:hypothetical protein
LHQCLIEAAKRHPGKQFWHPELKQDSQTAWFPRTDRA